MLANSSKMSKNELLTTKLNFENEMLKFKSHIEDVM